MPRWSKAQRRDRHEKVLKTPTEARLLKTFETVQNAAEYLTDRETADESLSVRSQLIGNVRPLGQTLSERNILTRQLVHQYVQVIRRDSYLRNYTPI